MAFIPFPQVLDLLGKNHDNLVKVVSKWAWIVACMLTFLILLSGHVMKSRFHSFYFLID